MIKNSLLKLFVITFLLCFLVPINSFADGGDATLTMEPKNPVPNSSVLLTFESYSFDVDTALITWSSGGKILLKGLGEKKLTIPTGSVGQRTPIHVTSVSADKSTSVVDIVITPTSVDILYETPESYTPLFYEGKSLPGEGALVNFVAVPNISEKGVILPAQSMAYSWYINDEFMPDASGMGRSSAQFNLDIFNNFTRVKVVARSVTGTSAEKYIDIYPHDVMPLLYTYDEVLGADYTSLIVRRFEATKAFILDLEPFYLSAKNSLADSASYAWAIDGLPVTPLGGRLLAMHPKENSYGSRLLNISISNSKRRFQEASADFNLVFDTRQ